MNREQIRRLITIFALVHWIVSCRTPPPATGPGSVVSCGVEAVQTNWPRILPAVNQCLGTAPDASWQQCLISLISPTAGITEDVLACVVRDQGSKFAQSADANPRDGVSARAAARAETFIRDRGYKFADQQRASRW